MEASTLQIYWHELRPIYSLCFQPSANSIRLVTGGGDNKIRIWGINFNNELKYKIETPEFISSLSMHELSVNVVRFNTSGDILASAGDDGLLLLWKKNDSVVQEFGVDEGEFSDFKESWYVYKRLRLNSALRGSEIYDLCWSPDGKYIVTGSMDNSVRIFDIEQEICITSIVEHNHYVQGVVWDPQNQFIISQSADRSVHIHKIIYDEKGNICDLKLTNRIFKVELPQYDGDLPKKMLYDHHKLTYLFHNETLSSFFRRLTMSPCGNLLCIPAGIFKTNENSENTTGDSANSVYIYTRSSINYNINKPILIIPFLKRPAIVISFNPNLYELNKTKQPWLNLPYKMVFAVGTSNEVFIFDTESIEPLAIVGNLHYTTLTDISWTQDGNLLMVSSTDGFCSYISIKGETIGQVYKHSFESQSIIEKRYDVPLLSEPDNIVDSFDSSKIPNLDSKTKRLKKKESQLTSTKIKNKKLVQNKNVKTKRKIVPCLISTDAPHNV